MPKVVSHLVFCTYPAYGCMVSGVLFQGWDVGTLGNTLSGCVTQDPVPQEASAIHPTHTYVCVCGCGDTLSAYIKLTFRLHHHSDTAVTSLFCDCSVVKLNFYFHQTASWLWLVWTNSVSALLVQSNSHDIGNEKSSEKFNFQFFGKLEIKFSLEINFQVSILLVGPWSSFHSFQLDEEMTQAKPILISNASSRIFLLSNFNIQYTGIVAGQSNTLGTVLLVTWGLPWQH